MKSHAAYLLSSSQSCHPELSHILLLFWNPSSRAELSAEITVSIQHWDLVFTAQTPSPHLPSMWSGYSASRSGGWPSPAFLLPSLLLKAPCWYEGCYSSLFYPLLVSANPWFTEELRPDWVIVLISISANFLQNIKCTQNEEHSLNTHIAFIPWLNSLYTAITHIHIL